MLKTLEGTLAQLSGFHPALQLLLIALSVAVSEEFAALGVFALARNGSISWWIAGFGTFAGAWAAQALFWLAGRISGHKALSWRIFRGLQNSGKLEILHKHVVREGWIAILAMRFLPGTRIPVCLGAGILGMGALEFLGVLTLATILWVFACMGFVQTFLAIFRDHPIVLLVGLVVVSSLLLIARSWFRKHRRAQLPG